MGFVHISWRIRSSLFAAVQVRRIEIGYSRVNRVLDPWKWGGDMSSNSGKSRRPILSLTFVIILSIGLLCLVFFTIPSVNRISMTLRAERLAKVVAHTRQDIDSVQTTLDTAKTNTAKEKGFSRLAGQRKKEIERLNGELEKLKHNETILRQRLDTYRNLLEKVKPKPSEDALMGTGLKVISFLASLFGAVAPVFSGIMFARSWLRKRSNAVPT